MQLSLFWGSVHLGGYYFVVQQGKNHWRFSLEGQGAYGANTTSHMIWGTATYDF